MIHCVLFINMLSCYFIFFLGGGSRKKRYVTKRGYQIKRYRPSHRGIGGQNAQFFCYLLIEQPLNLFLFSSKRESPYKSNDILLLSVIDSKLLQMDFALFIRSMRCKTKTK